MSDALLKNDPFSNETSKRLFNAIDDLRNCGAGQDLDLPQLVIVGNQSVGKSSLLRSLTDIPFSVGAGLCTRFATRIISRRTPPGTSDMVIVSIEPGDIDPFGYDVDDEPAKTFNYSVPKVTAETFETIVKQAAKYMGILGKSGSKKRNFSSKVLKIELSGPERSHFGILDLPGVFSVPTNDITQEEMDGVDKMVASYMRKPQNIIICVAPANNDLAHQKIFNLAKKNADSSRIVGVFTKCDAASRKEADYVVNVIKERKEIQLELGWFVVHNPDFEDPVSSNYRKAEEITLSKAPWLKLEPERRGIAVLKEFLAKLLCKQIRVAFPEMQKTIRAMLAAQEEKLARLGKPRQEPQERFQYLMNIVREYNHLAQQALTSPENLPSADMKLRGFERMATDEFAEDIKNDGHYHPFLSIGENSNSESTGNPLYKEIRIQIYENRGEELSGMMNPAVVKPLFKKQTSKWVYFGEEYLNTLISETFDVAMRILSHMCEENGVSTNTKVELEEFILKFRQEAGSRAIQKLKDFYHESITNPLHTNNETFVLKVKKAQRLRFKAALERYQKTHPAVNFLQSFGSNTDLKERSGEATQPSNGFGAPSNLAFSFGAPGGFGASSGFGAPKLNATSNPTAHLVIVDLNNITDLFDQLHPSGVQNKEDEIHDLLKAYYEVAREDYLFYVTHRIAEPFLQDKKGPLLGLSQEFILGLSREEQESLGAEDESVIKIRKELEDKIQRLKQAKNIADLALRRTKGLDD